MSTSDDIKVDLQRAREEVKRVYQEAMGDAKQTQGQLQQRLATARSKRDSLSAKLHQDIDARMRSLESERERLAQTVRGDVSAMRGNADERLRDVEKKIDVTRTELVAQADATLDEIDDEVRLLEIRARDSDPAMSARADKALSALRTQRDRLREKARALHDTAGERFREAKAEYDKEVAYLTERRNDGTIGIN